MSQETLTKKRLTKPKSGSKIERRGKKGKKKKVAQKEPEFKRVLMNMDPEKLVKLDHIALDRGQPRYKIIDKILEHYLNGRK